MKPDFKRAQAYVFARLELELSPDLTYHSARHTREDVLPAAICLGRKSRLASRDLLLLATGALFHDIGFVCSYTDHEEESIAIAQAALPEFDYSSDQVETISRIIRATKLPQSPTNLLEQLMCDADLDVLGRSDFWDLSQALLFERRITGIEMISDADWLVSQERFLLDHTYFTPAAHALRDAGKLRNLELVRLALASQNGSTAQSVGWGGER